MSLEKIREPYELLFRLGNGTVKGAHVKFLDVVKENGNVISNTPTPAEPVGADGFPLEKILDIVLIHALNTIEILTAERDLAVRDRNTVVEANAALSSQVETLQAQLSALQSQPKQRTISRRQAKLALLSKNLYTAVDDYVLNSGDMALKIEWLEADYFEYNSQVVDMVCDVLSLDKTELFDLAETL